MYDDASLRISILDNFLLLGSVGIRLLSITNAVLTERVRSLSLALASILLFGGWDVSWLIPSKNDVAVVDGDRVDQEKRSLTAPLDS
jgi:hypothetical protein